MSEISCTCSEPLRPGVALYCDAHELCRIERNGGTMTVRDISRAKAAKFAEGLKKHAARAAADGAGGVIFERGKAVQAVAGIVEIGVGALTWDYGIGIPLVEAGASQLLGYAASILLNPRHSPVQPIGASYVGDLQPRRIFFGELTVGGMYCAPPLTNGSNNDYLDLIFVFAGHPIAAYGDVYFNNIRIANADIGPVVGNPSTDGAVSSNVTNSGYEGLAWIRRYPGNQSPLVADAMLTSAYSAWDANHVGKNLAYGGVRLQYNQTAFATGVPNATFHAQGALVYDPRLDSTNGGSGSQRFATPSTWAYSKNPALCLASFLAGNNLGLGDRASRIDWALITQEMIDGQAVGSSGVGPSAFSPLARSGLSHRAILRRGRLSFAASCGWDAHLVRQRPRGAMRRRRVGRRSVFGRGNQAARSD